MGHQIRVSTTLFVWWTDGAPDFNRRPARETPYAEWYAGLGAEASAGEG